MERVRVPKTGAAYEADKDSESARRQALETRQGAKNKQNTRNTKHVDSKRRACCDKALWREFTVIERIDKIDGTKMARRKDWPTSVEGPLDRYRLDGVDGL